MSLVPVRVSEDTVEAGLGSLRGCLVDGDAEQCRRERRVRRRSLAISVAVQSALLTALVIVPLFGKAERIVLAKDVFIPMVPYGHPVSHPRGNTQPGTSKPTVPDSRFTFHPLTDRPVVHPAGEQNSTDAPDIDPGPNQPGDGPDCSWCVNIGSKNSGQRPPEPPKETRAPPRLVHLTQLDPAMLVHRVEPAYPELARLIHKEGRVELRAIIGADGTIQSLQVAKGDPLFDRSALDAVQQWRYKPTILNGQAVEIDTYITVIYTMQH